MLIADLHNHTTYSYDGSNSPEQIIENAVKHKIDVIGISDHQFSVREKLAGYLRHIYACREKYRNDITVLCGLEIGTRPKPDDFLASNSGLLDYCLFESLDSMTAMDFYEFLEWSKLFKCPIGFAHTDVFALSERYGLDVLKIMRERNIFWEINISGNYNYYYDFLTNGKKQQAVKKSGVFVSIGSDTHYLGEYNFGKLMRAHKLYEALGLRSVFGE